jgi:hypothetical protein
LRDKALAERAASLVLDGVANTSADLVSGKHALHELRKKCKNGLHLCSVLLKDRNIQLVGRIICEVMEHLRDSHLECTRILKDQTQVVGSDGFILLVVTLAWNGPIHYCQHLCLPPMFLTSRMGPSLQFAGFAVPCRECHWHTMDTSFT